ncbi:quercetin 2,3-dioxygenase [Mariprofundus micogutta]|uniref:Quercetin 2,3-dioxygenase n=1 Tax=Mariprofundus micogutta TaxID=1921010 RepID=A0A1L8CQR4_9PROT|nr:pirin family protein [Mariprofundus micogutta]GAV21233.1 quercetin 2,3-dioxygenase [Mariprofundus micogutta]
MSITIVQSVSVPEGDGVTVKRLMPLHGLRNFDPFVLWDHFEVSGGGFPDHPHRGFEAITYMFAGGMQHTDNLGNRGTVYGGGAQRFTAGRGIVHSEMPDGHAAGIQLWINLPKRLKGLDPDYQQVDKDIISETTFDGGLIRTIVGEGSAIRLKTDVEYLDISIEAGASIERNISEDFRGFMYVVEGSVDVNGETVSAGAAAYADAEHSLTINATEDTRFMWCFGIPHHESIYQHGPFVD